MQKGLQGCWCAGQRPHVPPLGSPVPSRPGGWAPGGSLTAAWGPETGNPSPGPRACASVREGVTLPGGCGPRACLCVHICPQGGCAVCRSPPAHRPCPSVCLRGLLSLVSALLLFLTGQQRPLERRLVPGWSGLPCIRPVGSVCGRRPGLSHPPVRQRPESFPRPPMGAGKIIREPPRESSEALRRPLQEAL